MPVENEIRKLAAILHADVKGYSRLMGEDESYTVGLLTESRKIFSGHIGTHGGRVVNAPGDSILAEFPSVVSAVQCAVDIQSQLNARNADLPNNRKMAFRMGVNLGDVIQSEDAIYGDGVNIAARIEALADPGGVAISSTVFNQVQNKLTYGYEYQGEHEVKNINKPLRVYRLLTAPEDAGKLIGEEQKVHASKWIWPTAVVAAVVVALLGYHAYQRMTGPQLNPASVEKMAYPLPEKPSIAVLPFDNLSGEPEQDYFSDGITEELITALSKIPKVFVISRDSTFTYKGKSVKVNKVAEELGVRYVLEGSVRKARGRVRITAKLVDALSGHHLWAERYDRELTDIFAVQDDITKRIVTAFQIKVTEGEQARYYAIGTDNLEAYLKYLQTLELFRDFKPGNTARARQLAEEAITLDPHWPHAYLLLGWTHVFDVVYGRTKTPAKSIEYANKMGEKALAMNENLGGAYNLLSVVFMLKKQHNEAIEYGKISVTINPNSANSYHNLGRLLSNGGKPEEGIPFFKKAIRLNPFAPSPYYYNYGYALWMMKKYQEAIDAGKEARSRGPNDMFSHMLLSVAYIELGLTENAHESIEEIIRIKPEITLEWLAKMLPWKKDYAARFIEDLRKAGLPD